MKVNPNRTLIKRAHFIFVVLALASCGQKGNPVTRFNLQSLDSLKHFEGDSIKLQLTREDVDQLNFRPVDSVFYQNYLARDRNFNGFNFDHTKIGGPSCYQYYYGIIQNRIPGYFHLLILQAYSFGDRVNDLFLLTFDKSDSLVSILPVASLIFQAEIEPIFSSTLAPDNTITKHEITINHIPQEVRWDSTLTTTGPSEYLICRDNVIKQFKFLDGKFILIKKDSLRNCIWKKSEN